MIWRPRRSRWQRPQIEGEAGGGRRCRKGEDFYFAGLGTASRLVNSARFREDDGIRIPSIVKAEADHTFKELSTDKAQTRRIHNVACAQPGGMTDTAAGGTIGLSFPSGPAGDIAYVRDLLRNPSLKQSRGKLFSPQGGDWPGEGAGA